jgi:tetraacyldisaccharide 4'-kinase
VVSVGNLSVGGSGKTPIVEALARLLLEMGEHPAILSRGYGRRHHEDGVVIASDREGVRAPVEQSGDEPQMLARSLPGVPVLVSPDRYLGGRLAERQFGCTVMLLDDGFQHLALGRNVDVVVMPAADLDDAVLPAGRLREGLDAACSADCLLVPGDEADVARVRDTFDRMPVFQVIHQYGALDVPPPKTTPASRPRVVAVAGIARPERFFAALAALGYDVARTLAFPDHHWYSAADLARVGDLLRQTQADLVVTTAKDAVRVRGQASWAVLPMTATIEPADRFTAWLRERL